MRFNNITFLGTGSAVPKPDQRNVSSLAITTTEGETFLVDCGEATQHQIMRCNTVKAEKITHIFITHLHGDHTFGLFGLLATLGTTGREKDLLVTGPTGIKALVEGVLGKCESGEGDDDVKAADGFGGMDPRPFRIKFRELHKNESIDLGTINGFKVSAHPLNHRVKTYGYVFEEPKKLGKLDAKKAMALGAKGPMLGKLKNGEDITLGDGTVIRSADMVGEAIKGRKIGVMQDTCDSSSAEPALQDVDVLIHECTYHHKFVEKSIEWGHSTAKMAGDFAHKVRAKMLVLSHFSARYCEPQDEERKAVEPEMTIRYLVKEASDQCPDTVVQDARDFMLLDGSKGQTFVVDPKPAMKESTLRRMLGWHNVRYVKPTSDEINSGPKPMEDDIDALLTTSASGQAKAQLQELSHAAATTSGSSADSQHDSQSLKRKRT